MKYRASNISEEGSKPEMLTRIAQAAAALSSQGEKKKSLEGRQHQSKIKDLSDAFPRDIYLPVCMRNLDIHH